jgi:2-oxoisovalerate dehydrogenase E1 component
MTKNLLLDPEELRSHLEITLRSIPINQYNKSFAEERTVYSKEALVRIYRDMFMIREFETMLYLLRTTQSYEGVSYKYSGPAHLSIGQEAAAVGQAFLLDENDFIFGSHRSHGEIIAKGLSAIEKLTDSQLMDIMENYFEGKILKVVEQFCKDVIDTKELAVHFLIYGLIAELFGKETGLTKGLGNSMHAFFAPFGSYPNNAIVGGSAPIAMGSALFKKINKKTGIVIANLGDGSMSRGPVWESMNMAAMDQFKLLWDEEYRGGLPIIFNFFNNLYAMGGQPVGETAGYKFLARVGAAVNPEQMHAERVDGYNPLAVIDAIHRKKEILKQGNGPVLLDTLTYRLTGHSPSDPQGYRTKEEFERWRDIDPLVDFKQKLLLEQVESEFNLIGFERKVKEIILKLFKLGIDDKISPVMDLISNPNSIASLLFSNQKIEKMEDRECEVLIPKEENPRVKQIKKKIRVGIQDGQPVSKLKTLQLRDALFESLLDKFYTDPTLVAYGEENRDWGGAYAVYNGLTESLPYHRLFNSPISESAIIGSAVGYGLSGGRAVVELMYADFLGCAGDEIFNQLAKWQAMSAGVLQMPIVVRTSVGSSYGAQHSQEWTSLVSHIPGLKVVYPATPYDAKGLLNAALNGTDPVIFFESQKLYDVGEMFHLEGVPEGYYEIPIGEPDIKREGKDITILTIGAALYRAVEAADKLEKQFGLSAEIIDARSIVPFNYEKVLESVKKTGKIVIMSDAVERSSVINDFARNITEMAFDDLDAPPVVIGARNWITPAFEYEKDFFPQADWIIDAIHQKIMPLKGHLPVNNFTKNEQIRRSRMGV